MRTERLGKGKIGEYARQARRRLREIDTCIKLSESTVALILHHKGKEDAQVVTTKLESNEMVVSYDFPGYLYVPVGEKRRRP